VARDEDEIYQVQNGKLHQADWLTKEDDRQGTSTPRSLPGLPTACKGGGGSVETSAVKLFARRTAQ